MRRAHSLRNHSTLHSRSTTLASTDDLGMLREREEEKESVEDGLRRAVLEKDREVDALLAKIASLEDELSQRPPLEDFKRLQAEKKEVDWLFASSNRENEKCMAKEARNARYITILERKLSEIVGADWQSTLNLSSTTTTALGDLSAANASQTSLFFSPQAESTVLGARAGTPDSMASPEHGYAFGGRERERSPMMTSSATITAATQLHGLGHRRQTSSPSPSFASPNPNVNSPIANSPLTHLHHNASTTSLIPASTSAAQAQATNATLAHITSLRTLILSLDSKMMEREEKLEMQICKATEESEKLDGMRAGVVVV
ncbi:hypothetical protein SCHPADRAFT_945482 [Schizopora paradoxa]|uniref:Uncharacterized protein n=1 Tax=Schizopora paradoxa TaxID=27342 RepID=A0A0H2R765_9AGAM|nr:hypothetical protein SCHPADRAFT_945482 [Schizopora paradoxa]